MSPMVEQAVKFNGSLPSSEAGPVKCAQTQVNGRRVDAVERILELKLMSGSPLSGPLKGRVEEFGEHLGRPQTHRVGQSRPGHRLDSQMVKFSLVNFQRGADIPETALARSLRIKQNQKLLPCGKLLDVGIGSMPLNRPLKVLSGNEVEQLAECRMMIGHGMNPPVFVGVLSLHHPTAGSSYRHVPKI